MSTSPLEKAIEIAGSQSALARLIGDGVKQQTVWHWLSTGKVAPEYCRAIERVTDGQVTRYELSPVVFGPAPREEITE